MCTTFARHCISNSRTTQLFVNGIGYGEERVSSEPDMGTKLVRHHKAKAFETKALTSVTALWFQKLKAVGGRPQLRDLGIALASVSAS